MASRRSVSRSKLKFVGRRQALAPAPERRRVEHGFVGLAVDHLRGGNGGRLRHGRIRGGKRLPTHRAAVQLLQPGPELELREQPAQRVHVRRAAVQVVRIDVQRHVAAHRGQVPVQRQLLQRGAQVLAHLAADVAGMGDHAVQRAVVGEPLGGGLGADLGHAGDVVDRVAGQGQEIGDQLRRHAEFLPHAGHVEHGVAHGVDQPHPAVHQLRQVLVGGRDQHLLAAAGGAPGQGADHVVRLHAVDHQQRQAERPHQLQRRARSAPPAPAASAGGWPCSRQSASCRKVGPLASNTTAMWASG